MLYILEYYFYNNLRDSHVLIGLKQSNSLWFHDLDIANALIGVALEFTENNLNV